MKNTTVTDMSDQTINPIELLGIFVTFSRSPFLGQILQHKSMKETVPTVCKLAIRTH